MQFKGDRVHLTEEAFGMEHFALVKTQLKWKDNKYHTKGLFTPKQIEALLSWMAFMNSQNP